MSIRIRRGLEQDSQGQLGSPKIPLAGPKVPLGPLTGPIVPVGPMGLTGAMGPAGGIGPLGPLTGPIVPVDKSGNVTIPGNVNAGSYQLNGKPFIPNGPLSNAPLYFRTPGDTYHGVKYTNDQGIDGPRLFGNRGGALGYGGENGENVAFWNNTGLGMNKTLYFQSGDGINTGSDVDWLRIRGSNKNGTALYNGLSVNDGGGLNVGTWGRIPVGQINATEKINAKMFCPGGEGATFCFCNNKGKAAYCAPDGSYIRDMAGA